MTYQQVGQQDGYENNEDHPQDVGHGKVRNFPTLIDLLNTNATGCLAEDTIEYKLSCHHGECLEDGTTRSGEGSRLRMSKVVVEQERRGRKEEEKNGKREAKREK